MVYLPEHPGLSRPGADRLKATAEAASNRAFARNAEAGFFAFFALILLVCQLQLRRLRRRGSAELDDPRGYRKRLVGAGVILLPLLVLVFGFHAQDAIQRKESLWPVVLGAGLALSVLGGTIFYALREGPARATARSGRLARWVVPLAVGIAGLRAIAWLAGRR